MNFIRVTAIIAVVATTLACNLGNDSKTDQNAAKTFLEKEPVIANQSEGFDKGNERVFKVDSAGRQQIPGDQQKKPSDQPTPPKIDWDKKIIKNASLNLEVKDYNVFSASLREKIKDLGGYISQEEQSQSDYKIENSIAIKIPVDQFDNAVVKLTANAEKLNEKKITSQDVTTQLLDIKSRMEAKRQVRLRYMDLLKQAKNMQEILSVQSEINGIQEEIESAAGRIEYLGHSSVFSTINLTYYQILNSTAKDNDKPSFGTELSNAFKNGWSWVGDLFVGLVSIWPLILLIFTGVIIYKRTKLQKPKQA